MTIDQAQRKLRRALKRLDPAQGKVARRNARTAIAYAIRQLRAAVDETFPPLKVATVRAPRAAPGVMRNRLRVQGYVALTTRTSGILRIAGFAIRVLSVGIETIDYGPGWAADLVTESERTGVGSFDLKESAALLRRARKSVGERKTVAAEIALVNCGTLPYSVSPRLAKERIRRDPQFRDAFLVAARVGHGGDFLKAQIGTATNEDGKLEMVA